MAKGLARITIACPHCGATQEESEHARSTFCRKCGKHIDLRKRDRPPAADGPPGPGIIDRLSRLFQRERVRQIHCLYCESTQNVSSFAKSGSCVQCGHYLDFRDVKIDGNFSKAIETHGTVTITRNGELVSPKVSCTDALIAGKVNGNLVCTSTARVRSKGRVVGSIQARQLIIEKRADVEFVRPLHVGAVEINGKISARIFANSVTINKNGALDGSVTAKSIKIEKGGIFRGDLVIGQQKEEQQELALPGQPAKSRKKRDDIDGNQMMLRPAT